MPASSVSGMIDEPFLWVVRLLSILRRWWFELDCSALRHGVRLCLRSRSPLSDRACAACPSDGSLPKRLKAFLERLKGLDSTGNLFLSSNHFKAPPQAVVESGIEAIEDYFSALFADDTRIQRHDTKAVLVGQEGAGKTR